MSLGDNLLLIGRAGYRFDLARGRSLEAGVTVQAPLGERFREYAGQSIPPGLQTDRKSDFGGEWVDRVVSGYLRGSFQRVLEPASTRAGPAKRD